MFYSQFILAKKGPLGTIWIAAHLERKLRKNQVTETNIDMSVDSILFPEVPIALRLSGHLLLGVVRIYSRKVNYLFHDCSEALTKIKQVFHSGIVDLPPEASTAPFHSVTLPESFDLDELELIPAREGFSTQGSVDHYVTTREQITLQDPMEVHAYLASDFDLDERFPDGCAPQINIEFDEEQWSLTRKIASPSSPTLEEDVLPAISADDKIDLDKADDEDVQGPCTPGLAPEAMDLDERANFTLCQFDRLELGDRLEPSDGMPVLEADYFPLDISEEQNIEGSGGIPGIKGAESEPVTAAQTVPENGLEARDRELQCLPLLETLDAQTQVIQNLPRLDTSHSSVGIQAVLESTEHSVNMRPVSEELFPMHSKDVQPGAEIPDVEKVCSVPDIQPELDLLSSREHSNDDNTIHNADISFLDTNLDTSQVPDLDLVNPGVMLVEDVMVPHEEGTPFVNDPLGSDLRKLPSPAEADLPGDDDLLATILGRRTPALAVVSTPSEAPAAKRQRTVPKLVTKKRKQALDLSAVLHGDLIRQQLASTDDIRRVRRKAPCTQREIWDAEKEAHGQLIFMEPLIPGMCDKLQKLYHHAPSAGSTKPPLMPTANNIAKDSFVAGETPTNQMHDKMPSTSVLTDSEKQTLEKDTTENSLSSDEAIMDLEKRNQEEVSHEDHGHLNKNEVATYKNGKEASDSYLQQACVEIQQETIHDTSASLPGGAIQVEEYMETSEVDRERLPNKEQVVERGDCLSEADTNTKTNGTVQLECQAAQDEIFIYVDHNKPATDGKLINEIAQADTHTEAVLELGHKAEVQDLFLETVEDKSTDNNMPSGLLEANETTRDEDTGSNMLNEEPTESIAGNEEPKAEDHRIIEQQAHHRDQANNITILDIDVNLSEEGTLDQNRTTLIENEQSTGLNFLGDKHRADKDIIFYDIEDYETEYPEEEPHDKSGWSSRTRAVGQYLKTRFEVLGADCKINYNPELGLDHLLIGKTRREAARMFFETLVLKTKDYINVEQGNSFESIHISARAKLMKAEF